MLYKSILYPNLIYCNIVWGACAKTNLSQLQIIQNKLVRVICFKAKYDHTEPLFSSLNILNVTQINMYMFGIFTFKSLAAHGPHFTPYICPYNTRLSTMTTVALPNIVSTHSRQSVRWVGSRLWNELPEDIRSQETNYSFKFKLKRHLLGWSHR